MEYNFREIEKKWQQRWVENKTYRVTEDESKKKFMHGTNACRALMSSIRWDMMLTDFLPNNTLSRPDSIPPSLPSTISTATANNWTKSVSVLTGTVKSALVNRVIIIGHNGLSSRCSTAFIAIPVHRHNLSAN